MRQLIYYSPSKNTLYVFPEPKLSIWDGAKVISTNQVIPDDILETLHLPLKLMYVGIL